MFGTQIYFLLCPYISPTFAAITETGHLQFGMKSFCAQNNTTMVQILSCKMTVSSTLHFMCLAIKRGFCRISSQKHKFFIYTMLSSNAGV